MFIPIRFLSFITLLKWLLSKFQCTNSPLPTPLVDIPSVALLAAFEAIGHSLHLVILFHFSSKIYSLAFLQYLSGSFILRLLNCSLTVRNSVCSARICALALMATWSGSHRVLGVACDVLEVAQPSCSCRCYSHLSQAAGPATEGVPSLSCS